MSQEIFGDSALTFPRISEGTTRDTDVPLAVKPPRLLLSGLFAFPPNRDTLGGTAYFIVEKAGNILVDCPHWNQENQHFFKQQGGVRWLLISHRGGISKKIGQMQAELQCEILIQEQEAYLLPEVPVTPFAGDFCLERNFEVIYTPGHSPGSSCLYGTQHGGILFSGRHLLPNAQGNLVPLRLAKTFHWFRQLQSVEKLRDRFSDDNLSYIFPSANIGFLRGKGFIEQAYQHISTLDLVSLRQAQTLL